MIALSILNHVPPRLRIGVFDVTVAVMPPPWSDNEKSYGTFNFNPPSIALAGDIACPVMAATVLRHEINHAIFHSYCLGDGETEERIVDVMANAWVQIERDNPELRTWFARARNYVVEDR